MEISIETLAGTSFELRVSPFETVISVKQKIQRLEGNAFPISTLLVNLVQTLQIHYINKNCFISFLGGGGVTSRKTELYSKFQIWDRFILVSFLSNKANFDLRWFVRFRPCSIFYMVLPFDWEELHLHGLRSSTISKCAASITYKRSL